MRRLECLTLLLLLCLRVVSFAPRLGRIEGNFCARRGPTTRAVSEEAETVVEAAPPTESTPAEEQAAENDASESSSKEEKKPWWKRVMRSSINAVSSCVKAISKFRKRSGIQDFEDSMLAALRNTTVSQKLQAKYQKPDTSAARVEILVNDFTGILEDKREGEYDIDKVVAALQSLNNLLLRNGTMWELAQEFTGSWRIFTANATLQSFNISLFPLIIPNISIALIDPDNVELVKLFGEFEFNTPMKKFEFRFPEMAVLGIRAELPDSKVLPFPGKAPPTPMWGKKTKAPKATVDDGDNKTRPFQSIVATNETSETMNDILSWFDDWYGETASEEWYDELISDEM